MNSTIKVGIIFAGILIFITAVGCALVYVTYSESDSRLLERIALVQPGVKFGSIKNRLGEEVQVVSDPDFMVTLGAVKNRSFCEGKRMHRIPLGMGGRELSVYTDSNDVVVYVSWLQE